MARQEARILAQNLEFRFANPGARDRFMAENLHWILDFEGPEAKLVAWAHNAHVAADPGDRNGSMGTWLRKQFGAEVVNFGFAFNQGSLRARDMAHAGEVRSFAIGPAPPGSLDAVLAGAGLSIAAVDLRALPKSGPVAAFFRRPLLARWAGAGFVKGGFAISKTFPEAYDALLFVEKTSAAEPLPEGLRAALPKPLPRPANLDFEQSTADGRPACWSGAEGIAGVEYAVKDVPDRPHGGQRCAVIERVPGRHYGEVFGQLSQRINAEPFRGREVRLRAAVRLEGASPDSQAYLWLKVESLLGPDFYATAPIVAPQWQICGLSAPIKPSAQKLSYGLAFVGEGRAAIDDLTLTPAGVPARLSLPLRNIAAAALGLGGVGLALFTMRHRAARAKCPGT
jgi:erythromycin esterase